MTTFTHAIGTPDFDALLSGIKEDHPRLILTPAGLESLRSQGLSDPVINDLVDQIRQRADAILGEPVSEYRKEGRRLLAVSREVLSRINHLALTCRISGDSKYGKRAIAELQAAAAFPDWNSMHFLDTAEMSTAFAIGLDWLHDLISEEERRELIIALVEKGLKPSFDEQYAWWTEIQHNWNQVCHGGMVLGALEVSGEYPALAAKILKRAYETYPEGLKPYHPDGIYPEGPTYWSYGTHYSAIMFSALRTALGTDFSLENHPALGKSTLPLALLVSPSGSYYNFSDSGSRVSVQPAIFWFGREFGQTAVARRQYQHLKEELESDSPGISRFLPFMAVWFEEAFAGEPEGDPLPLHWHGAGKTQLGLHRSSWEDDALYLGIKGGGPRVNHAHMDAGSFIVESDGVRWAVDLGSQNYHSLESVGIDLWNSDQDSDRWTVFRLGPESHAILRFNNGPQFVDGRAEFFKYGENPEFAFTVFDLSAVYPNSAQRVLRGAAMEDGSSVIIQDEAYSLSENGMVKWQVLTEAEVSVEGSVATLEQDGERFRWIIEEPSGSDWSVIVVDTRLKSHDHPNPGVKRLEFEIPVKAGDSLRIRVRGVPQRAFIDSFDTGFLPVGSW